MKELKEVTDDWKLLGVSLGIPVRKLKAIKLDDPHGGVENWKLEMFQIWLQSKPGASWKNVVQALEDNDYHDLAEKLKKKYLLANAASGDQGIGVYTIVGGRNHVKYMLFLPVYRKRRKFCVLRECS